MKTRFQSGVLTFVGFMLSPLSWWNDAFVNVPLAYVFSIPFTMISDRLSLPALLVGYWLTNIAGLVLLHAGVRRMAAKPAKIVNWKRDILVSLAYSLLIAALALAGWLRPPWEYFR